MNNELSRAHRESLELMKIIDDFCVSHGIKYTIAASMLIRYCNDVAFSEGVPEIQLAMLSENYKVLTDYLDEFCRENAGYSVHNCMNTKHFDSDGLWFIKKSRVVLPPERKDDEIYYSTHLSVIPVYYGGNTVEECAESYRKYQYWTAAMDSRAALAQKPVRTRIKTARGRINSKYFRSRRDRFSYKKLVLYFGSREKTKYVMFPGFNNRKNPFIVPKKEYIGLTRDDLEDVERIELEGVGCYCLKSKEKMLAPYSSDYIESVLKKNSNQLRMGGHENLRRLQLIQKDLLVEFDRVCRKNGLRYNISFGTLLGAVRHKGFVPWDDDVDVAMPWEDYDKLAEAMERDLDHSKYFLANIETEEKHHLTFMHLERKGTVYTKTGREDKLNHVMGVFLDITPMYPAAPNAVIDWFHAKVCRFWRTALWSTVGADSEKDPVKRFYYQQLAKFGNKKCLDEFIKNAMMFRNDKGRLKFWIAMDRNPYNVPLVDARNYDDTVELEFEGHKFLAPANYEAVLDYCYGLDWRMYLPMTRRNVNHNALIDLGDLYSYDSENEVICK